MFSTNQSLPQAKAGCSQFTGGEFVQTLQEDRVNSSMDGNSRYDVNILVDRLWRIVKYEEVYLKNYASAIWDRTELGTYFWFYNNQRPRQSQGYRTPDEVFHEDRNAPGGNKGEGRST